MSPSSKLIIGMLSVASALPLALLNVPSSLDDSMFTGTHQLRAVGDQCSSHHTIITKLVMYNVLAFVAALLTGHRFVTRKICCKSRRSPDDDTTVEFGVLGLLLGLAWTIGFTYLTAVITRQDGTSTNHGVWQYFQLWAIQPRATPFIMLLGYFRGWTGTAFSLVIADSVLSLIAIQFQGSAAILGGDFSQQSGSWPIYRIGAVIAILPLILFVLLGLLLGIVLIIGGACYVCLSVVTIISWCCGIKSESRPSTMPWATKDYGWYTCYVVLFIIMHIGRWMMWSGLPLEIYCPTMSQRVDLIWGLGPFGMHLIMLLVTSIG